MDAYTKTTKRIIAMNTDRTINFGKYKGTPIKQLILEHIGYIYWSLSNLDLFKLNADEQALYDAVAIANIKYEIDLVFLVRELAKFIVDKESYSKLDTPFIISRDGIIRYAIKDADNPIISDVLKYKDDNIKPLEPLTTDQMACINRDMFEPMDDEPLVDYFIGENPHAIVE